MKQVVAILALLGISGCATYPIDVPSNHVNVRMTQVDMSCVQSSIVQYLGDDGFTVLQMDKYQIVADSQPMHDFSSWIKFLDRGNFPVMRMSVSFSHIGQLNNILVSYSPTLVSNPYLRSSQKAQDVYLTDKKINDIISHSYKIERVCKV